MLASRGIKHFGVLYPIPFPSDRRKHRMDVSIQ